MNHVAEYQAKLQEGHAADVKVADELAELLILVGHCWLQSRVTTW